MRIGFSFVIVGLFTVLSCNATLYEGDTCVINSKAGICTHQDNCIALKKAFYNGLIRNEEIPRCGYSIYKEIVCCPNESFRGNKEFERRASVRPAVEYCNQIEQDLKPLLTEHILGGLPVNPGEYPHMAAIGYIGRLGDDIQPYEYGCGGSLIASKFVLTAAHCVVDPRRQPQVVLLGAISLTAKNDGIHINITKTYPHPEYIAPSTYNDIAIIELESDVEFSLNIYPACLHTNYSDLPLNTELYVSGWGQTEKKRHSDVLLTAKMNLVSVEDCNKEVESMSTARKLGRGVLNTQVCAEDSERDTCLGDSGGPLMYIKNKDLGHFRIVGVTASGFSCGGGVPSFYTRVSAYLDFIEQIVWPNVKLS